VTVVIHDGEQTPSIVEAVGHFGEVIMGCPVSSGLESDETGTLCGYAPHRGGDRLTLDRTMAMFPPEARRFLEHVSAETNPRPVLVPGTSYWLVATYHDVSLIVRDTRRFRTWAGCDFVESSGVLQAGETTLSPTPLQFLTAPRHHRVKRIMAASWFGRHMARVRAAVEAQSHRLLRRLTRSDEIELMQEFAAPIAGAALASFYGLTRDDWSLLHRGGVGSLPVSDPDVLSRQDGVRRIWPGDYDAAVGFRSRLMRSIADRDSCLETDGLADLVTALGAGSPPLELADLISIVEAAGLEGEELVANLICLAVDDVVKRPALIRCAAESSAFLRGAIAETLRLRPPARLIWRQAAEEVEIASQRIPARAVLLLWVEAANTDPAAYVSPRTYDPLRSRPRAHFGFGAGAHRCISPRFTLGVVETAVRVLLTALRGLREGQGLTFASTPPSLRVCEASFRFDSMALAEGAAWVVPGIPAAAGVHNR
jgi:cytochrome P450